MRLIDGMGGNPHWLYQGANEPLGLSRLGRSSSVSSMPLKGTGDARGKPRRCRAWLRDRKVSPNEVDQPTGKGAPGSRPCLMGQRVSGQAQPQLADHPTQSHQMIDCDKGYADEPDIPRMHSGTANKQDRLLGDHHLNDLVESTNGNMGGPSEDAKESGSNGLATTLKTSNASEGSQRGHSSQSEGKPRTWRRATACRCFGAK